MTPKLLIGELLVLLFISTFIQANPPTNTIEKELVDWVSCPQADVDTWTPIGSSRLPATLALGFGLIKSGETQKIDIADIKAPSQIKLAISEEKSGQIDGLRIEYESKNQLSSKELIFRTPFEFDHDRIKAAKKESGLGDHAFGAAITIALNGFGSAVIKSVVIEGKTVNLVDLARVKVNLLVPKPGKDRDVGCGADDLPKLELVKQQS